MREPIHRYEYLTLNGAAGTVVSRFSKPVVRALIAKTFQCPQSHVVIRKVS